MTLVIGNMTLVIGIIATAIVCLFVGLFIAWVMSKEELNGRGTKDNANKTKL